ncbi:hypothetical protein PUNSTDRAFT_146522 [Punctularia strigosozonata HHB-11173 SS5]|uniref:Protein kinase domain-containing protein n=1 Tax=Punctularia strigosozonata (strain HHB-11173) TaxID=741275 RepID=R7S352_PUNST|nr:uncharacterized protein PUNSTDRAFT_146522 [Punctularia strigosozonata HHB-11173 SS5]EIN04264.1 hypothetical protein PUNSTDRAFT_146522 [Punctularia strigosozonata HHB-11173 SS5]
MMYDDEVDVALQYLPRPQFFVQTLPQNLEDGKRFIEDLKQLRIVAMTQPMFELLPCDLSVVDIWAHPQKLDRDASYRYRPRPFEDTQLAAASPGNTVITLKKPIRTKVDTHSQVYKGDMRIGSEKSREVFVKIYQQSLRGLPEERCFDDNTWPVLWRHAGSSAALEAWAYNQLTVLQGSMIPYSFGFYKVELPHKEVSIVHVLEYLDGATLRETDRITIEKRLGCSLLHAAEYIMPRLYRMQRLGIIHGDLDMRNIMLLRSIAVEDPRSALVIVDFNEAQPSGDGNDFMDALDLLALLRELGVHINDIEGWYLRHANSNPRPEWLAMFGTRLRDDIYFTLWMRRMRIEEKDLEIHARIKS